MQRKTTIHILIGLLVLGLAPGILQGQDPSSLSEAERAALLDRYSKSKSTTPDTSSYRTPSIYSAEPQVQKPVRQDSIAPAIAHGLTPFTALRPFGSEIFSGPRESAPPSEIASDDEYLLGPGDEILIYLYGRADEQFQLTVDREGKVFIPQVGEVPASGKTLGQFKSEVGRRLSKIYSETQVTISLGKIRSIRIFLTGEVSQPGAYTVSSLTSVYNALFLAGGPNVNGSMRSVQLNRGGKTILNKDLYDFLLKGDNSFDTRLESGDVIFLPVAGTRVAVRGEVIRPAIYELRGDQTARDLLELAGGPTPQAHLKRVHLERISEDTEWSVFDLDLSPDAESDSVAAMFLHDGDRVTVNSVFGGRKNRVAIFGKVKYPGYYERSDTTTLAGLIMQSRLQDYDVYLERASLFRRYTDWRTEIIPFDLGALMSDSSRDIPLQDLDSIHIYSLQEVRWDRGVYIQGEVKKPGRYEFYPNMTTQDLIFLAGSFTKGAYKLWGEIARTDSVGQVSVSRLDLLDSTTLATVLQEDDRLYIRQIPEWQLHPTVSLLGEVRFPGEYVLTNRNETLLNLIDRAGGFTPEAFPRGTVFLRPTISQTLDQLNVRKQLEKSMPLMLDSLGQPMQLSFVEYEPGSVNRIAIDVERVRETEGKEGNLILQHGDQIVVPPTPSGISVLGAVGINGTIQFREDSNVKYYIERAGGFTRRADEDHTRLIRANGMAYSGGGTMGQKVDLGDIIAVPTKVERESHFTRNLVTILTVVTASMTAIILVTKI